MFNEGALEGKEEYRSRRVEMEWGHPDGSTWVSKSETEGDLFLSEGRVLQKDTEEDQRSFLAKSRRRRRKEEQ